MRAIFIDAYQDIANISSKRQILNIEASSEQQYFLQIVGNLSLLNKQEDIGQILKILQSYRGSYSALILYLKYVSYSMEKQLSDQYGHFTVLKLLAKWVETHENLKKKKDIRLYPAVVESLDKGLTTYEQYIAYLNYISLDLISLIKSGNQETRKQSKEQGLNNNNSHLSSNDLIQLLKSIHPKILFNLNVPRSFFPQTMLKSQEEFIDILYSYQSIQNMIHNKPHYIVLIKTIFKVLLSMDLQANQLRELIICSFNYYYMFHHDKQHNASQVIIQSFKKISATVRYAISQEICNFLNVLKKLGKELFINYLTDKFSWVGDTFKQGQFINGGNKSSLKPFLNKLINNSQLIKVEPGKTNKRYIQVYDRFSLLYFSLNCIEYDITIHFYYLGDFDKPQGSQGKKLLFGSEKKQGIFQGSIEAIEKGIYLFELDNTYSWVKSKFITYDCALLTPLQIREHKKNPIKSMVFEKQQVMNEVPYQNVKGWVDQNQIKLNSASANVKIVYQERNKIYNLKVTSNAGGVYEYETQSKIRFIKKAEQFVNNSNIFWMIDGYRVEGIKQVKMWIQGDYQPDKTTFFTKQTGQVESKGNDGTKIQEQKSEQKQTDRQEKIIQQQQKTQNKQEKFIQHQQQEQKNKTKEAQKDSQNQRKQSPYTQQQPATQKEKEVN